MPCGCTGSEACLPVDLSPPAGWPARPPVRPPGCPASHPPCLDCHPSLPSPLIPSSALSPPPLPAGYQVATLGSGLSTCTEVPNLFSDTCNSLKGALMVTEVDASCKVRLFIAGDAGCSSVNNLTVVEG